MIAMIVSVIVSFFVRTWKVIVSIFMLTSLKNKFSSLPGTIRMIITAILALVPSGLIAIAVYAKYTSYLNNIGSMPGVIEYFVIALISLFGIIILGIFWFIIHRILTMRDPIAVTKDGVIITGRAGKKAMGHLSNAGKTFGNKTIKGTGSGFRGLRGAISKISRSTWTFAKKIVWWRKLKQ
ncbi:hypothetical protein KAS42_02050 [bacterium]|nr:hypothetical protein [bacterium]